ncbi:hypothetical protein M433DRAFT_397193, partial [Acidomyces richmondensis BFW]
MPPQQPAPHSASSGKPPPPAVPVSPVDGAHKSGLVLRVHVAKGRDLAAKDKSGTSDPFLVLALGERRQATSVVSKTLHPEWNQTVEFPVTDADSGLLEVVCWDKDRFKKDYMGEFDVMLDEIFAVPGQTITEPRWFRLEGRRHGGRRRQKKDADVSGEVQLKFTLFDPTNTAATQHQVWQKFQRLIAPPEDNDGGGDDDIDNDNGGGGVGSGGDRLHGVLSRDLDDVSEGDEEDEEREPSDETDEGARTPGGTLEPQQQRRRRRARLRKLKRKSKLKAYEFNGASDVAGVLFLEINRICDLPPERNVTKTGFDMDPFVVTSLGKKTYRTRVVNHNLNPVYDEKLVFQVLKSELSYSVAFTVVDRDKFSGNDFVGTALLPVDKVRALAPEADPETGLYRLPDPDATPETRRRRWRVPMSRSSSQSNLPGRNSHTSSQTNLPKLAKSTSNTGLSQLGGGGGGGGSNGGNGGGHPRPGLMRQDSDSSLLIDGLHSRPAPTSVPSSTSVLGTTSSAIASHEEAVTDESSTGLVDYELPLELKNKSRWEDKHNPTLHVRAKYLPYRALRQQFWRAMLRQYDADESGKIDRVELVTMLDTLGSTLHNRTIDGFFRRFREENNAGGGEGGDILTMDQAVICLEEQLMRSVATHRDYDTGRGGAVPLGRVVAGFSGSSPEDSPAGGTPYLGPRTGATGAMVAGAGSIPVLEVSDLSDTGGNGSSNGNGNGAGMTVEELELREETEEGEEHVVEIHECPICHLPRLTRGRRTTDADIITHIATCASSDWRAVNNLVMAGFVTSSQAQRKWWSKVITKVSYGGYRLGANSANILVQDRVTGVILEERMSVYVRLGIRLLYKGLKSSSMEGKKSEFVPFSLSLSLCLS